jgi:cation diffusion facilitator CzcD-associated flavoprotein CzcO
LPQTNKNSDREDQKHSDESFFKGQVLHSSHLDDLDSSDLEGKSIAVIGSGASGVEAVETALSKGANGAVMFARDDKV